MELEGAGSSESVTCMKSRKYVASSVLARLIVSVCPSGVRLFIEKKMTLFKGSDPVTCGATKVTVGELSTVYVETGVPYMSVTPTGPTTDIEEPV